MIDMPNSSETQLFGVNNSDDLVGDYQDPNGVERGFLATVHEPASLVLCRIGLAAAAGYARRRKARG
jgi:hypothetical protein